MRERGTMADALTGEGSGRDDVYRRLARHLDELPAGFPPTESGVELRILRRLFTPDEAELALTLTVLAEEPRVVARRARIPVAEASERLEALARKGLAFSLISRDGAPRYLAVQFAVGLWEFSVNRLDPELVRDVNEYLPLLVDLEVWKKAPQLRTIPVGRAIPVERSVLAYEEADQLVRGQRKIVVAPCICRREHKLAGGGCSHEEGMCLVFGLGADYYERNGLGRVIGADEGAEILRRADRDGLVLQPGGSQKAGNICCCCPCCCQVLLHLARHPKPAEVASSSFAAVLDPRLCTGCGVCEGRCPMGALSVAEAATFEPHRCIGCGLCVSACPTGALRLERKSEGSRRPVPRTATDAALRLARARGKLGTVDLARLLLKSKWDRLRS